MKNKWISALITFAVIVPVYLLANHYGADEKLFIGFVIGSFYDHLYKFILHFFERK